jgi:hypothetical protein
VKLVTIRSQILDVADRWRRQYPNDKRDIAEKLVALDKATATPDDVTKIIGNKSWIGPEECDECGTSVEVYVEIGEEPDYESNTAHVCGPCLRKAVGLVDSAENGSERP